MQTIRYNGYPTMRIAGDAAPGVSTGEAMAEMERLAGAAAAGLRLRMDRPVARGAPGRRARRCILFGFSLLAVFLCLAALYESWSIPLRGDAGGAAGRARRGAGRRRLRGFSNDVYFKVGLITIIGLSAKNAVLIIEFAKDLQAQGTSAVRGGAGRPRTCASGRSS